MLTILLGPVDYLIIAIYFAFVLGIGFLLRRTNKTSTDFFLSGRSIPAWICGLAFISANLGAQEIMGMGASGAQYGIMTAHFYWIGAIPAMVFVGIFMLPFYYGSKARSVPEFLKLRFDEKTRGFNAFSFAVMTTFSSGISMYALAILLEALLGWSFIATIVLSGLIVLIYIYLGGLTSAIYNEVLQFFLMVAAFIPLVFLGLEDIGGWSGLTQKLNAVAMSTSRNVHVVAPGAVSQLSASQLHTQAFAAGTWSQTWAHVGSASANPMNVSWIGLAMGLGFVLSFAYWCTDFLVIQRALAAESMAASRRTPIIAAIPKMFFPFLIIVPGMIAMALAFNGKVYLPVQHGSPNYNMAIPLMLQHYFPQGILGLGLTALMASFMSGMAGNVTAFNTVWTYDIYQAYIAPNKSDRHYLWMGRFTTLWGIGLAMAVAGVTTYFSNIMNMLQLVFAYVNAPLLATFLLGMFWKRSTGHGAFWGLVCGTLAAVTHQLLTGPKGGVIGPVHVYQSVMAQNFWTAIFAFSVCVIVTVVVSLATAQRKTNEQLKGLVWSMTPRITESGMPWFKRPVVLGVVVLIATVVLNLIFA